MMRGFNDLEEEGRCNLDLFLWVFAHVSSWSGSASTGSTKGESEHEVEKEDEAEAEDEDEEGEGEPGRELPGEPGTSQKYGAAYGCVRNVADLFFFNPQKEPNSKRVMSSR